MRWAWLAGTAVYHSPAPPANESWRNDFVASPAQPFRGTVQTESFCIIRLRTEQARRAAPLPLAGTAAAVSPPGLGSRLALRRRVPRAALLLHAASWLLALLVLASALRESDLLSLPILAGFLFFLIPAGLTAAYYAWLRSEATRYVALLGPLLGLSKLPI